MKADDYRPQTYRDWLDKRFNDEIEDDESDDLEDEEEAEDGPDDGFPLHDRYDEESSP